MHLLELFDTQPRHGPVEIATKLDELMRLRLVKWTDDNNVELTPLGHRWYDLNIARTSG